MNIRDYLKDKYIIFDGAFGTYYTEITGITDTPEFANSKNKDTVVRIHKEYIEAGANVIRTNSFAINSDLYGNKDDYSLVKENLRLAVAHAKEAIKCSVSDTKDSDTKMHEKSRTMPVFIAGSIGPIASKQSNELIESVKEENINLGQLETTDNAMSDEYTIIANELASQDIDAIVFETLSSLEPILPAIHYIKEKYANIFIIVQFCVNQFGYTNSGLSCETLMKQAMEDKCIDAAGLNCGVGPGHMETLLGGMDLSGDTFITALPNASYPRLIRDRMVFMNNERYFLDKIQAIAQQGVDFLGGCCGTRPDYIRLIAQYVANTPKAYRYSKQLDEACENIKPIDNSFYNHKNDTLDTKKLIAVELAPPMDQDDKKVLDAANSLKGLGVDVLTFPDSPSGRTRADAILMATKVAGQTGMCVMPHICCRDKNAIAIRSQLLGAQINDITNFLVITGDPISTLMRQDVKSVFNFDSCGLMRLMKDMNETHFKTRPLTYGGCINYARHNLDFEIKRVHKKMDMGATFFFTQPVFCKEDVEKIRHIKELTGARILCGLMPLVSYRNASFIKNEMAGINVPDEVLSMYEGVNDKATGEKIGVGIARKMMELANDFADGFYFSIPFNRVYLVKEILKGNI